MIEARVVTKLFARRGRAPKRRRGAESSSAARAARPVDKTPRTAQTVDETPRAAHTANDSPSTGPIVAVRDLSLTIERGEIVALLGPNGAGKTTLMDMLLGLTFPTAGTISIDGMSPREAVTSERVGAMLQTGGLLPDLTVRDTIRMVGAAYAHPMDLESVLASANLTGLQHRLVKACSGGEQQRVRFALALLGDPELLILDEPTAGMDPQARRAFWNAMRAQAHSGRTIVFATHYLEEASQFAERIVMMAAGRVVADGPVAEIRAVSHVAHVEATIDSGELPAIPNASAVTWNGSRVRITTTAPDATALALLTAPAPHTGRELLLEAGSLDDAFHALTSGSAAAVEPDAHPARAADPAMRATAPDPAARPAVAHPSTTYSALPKEES